MRLPRPAGPHYKRARPGRVVIAISAILIAAHGAYTCWSLERSYDRTLFDAGSRLASMAAMAARDTGGSLSEIDAMLAGIERIAATVLPGSALGGPELDTVLRAFDDQRPGISDLLVLDSSGRAINRTRTGLGELADYSQRLFFTALRSAAASSFYIEAPRANPLGGGGSLTISRPFLRNRMASGVIAAVVPISALIRGPAAFAAMAGAGIAVLPADDQAAAAGNARRPPAVGGTSAFDSAILKAAAHSKAGLIETEDGGVLRAFCAVPGSRLIVAVSRERGEILHRWYGERDARLTGLGLFAATVVSLAWLAARALRQGQFSAARLRRGEARLKRRSALLQNTLDNIGEGLSVFDSRGRLIARNARFCELLDLSPDLPVGTTLSEILMRQAVQGAFGDVDPSVEIAWRREQFYQNVPITKERVTPAGRILQIKRSAMPDGAVLSVYSDVTEIRTGERRLLQARSQAEAASHSKSEFLANMSHELRTPLNAIIGFTEIISQQLFGPIANEKYLEYVRDVHSSSLHLLSIINDVLDMSKIEAGKLELEKQAVTLQDVLGDVIRIVRERASARGIELVSRSLDDPVVIWADERAIKQIFLNLLSNAIKFSRDEGKIYIRVMAESAGHAAIEVEDRGIGMNEEEQERAMQPFGQAKPATTRNYGGTGLGLPITNGLVEAHGGTLSILSRPGEGTIVRVVLATHVAQPVVNDKPDVGAELARFG